MQYLVAMTTSYINTCPGLHVERSCFKLAAHKKGIVESEAVFVLVSFEILSPELRLIITCH